MATSESVAIITPSSSMDSGTSVGNKVWELDTERPLWQRMMSLPFWRRLCLAPRLGANADEKPPTQRSNSACDSMDNPNILSKEALPPSKPPSRNTSDSPMTQSLACSESDLDLEQAPMKELFATNKNAIIEPNVELNDSVRFNAMVPECDSFDSLSSRDSTAALHPGLSRSEVVPPPPLPPPPPPQLPPPSPRTTTGGLKQQQLQQRPPRSALQRAASYTTTGGAPATAAPLPTAPLARPEPNRNRALSSCSTASRHRRANVALDLPPMQSLVGDACDAPESTVVPLVTIDPAKCRRQISAWDDDDVFNLSSDSDDEPESGAFSSGSRHRPVDDDDDDDDSMGGDVSDDGSASPTSVVHSNAVQSLAKSNGSKNAKLSMVLPPLAATKQQSSAVVSDTMVAQPPGWMQAWAAVDAQTCSKDAEPAVHSSRTRDAEKDSTESLPRHSVTYLPLEPRPKDFDDETTEAIFTGGWVCAYGEGLRSTDLKDTGASLYYLQLLQGGVLQFLAASVNSDHDERPKCIRVPFTTRDCVQIVPATLPSHGHLGGCCLTIPTLSICIWPVPVPEGIESVTELVIQYSNYHNSKECVTTVASSPRREPMGEDSRNDSPDADANNTTLEIHEVSDDEDDSVTSLPMTPQAQHDAVLHLRFALDAALRSSARS
jgi:hypothetical protein